MKTKREVLERFAEEGYCSGIDCRECAYLELCSSNESLSIKGRLQRIGAMAILKMFPEKKKLILEVGTKIKFSDGSIATISKVDCGNAYSCLLEFGDGHNEYTDYLIGRTWEVVKE